MGPIKLALTRLGPPSLGDKFVTSFLKNAHDVKELTLEIQGQNWG